MKLFGGMHRKKRAEYEEYTDAEELDMAAKPEGEDEVQRDGEDEQPERTAEEKEEIERIIANYQRYKKRKRTAILSVLLALIAGGAILYGTMVRPPDIKTPVVTPSVKPTDHLTRPTDNGEGEDGNKDAPDIVDEPGTKTRKESVRTFLLVGMEQSFSNTDTIMLGIIDTDENKVNIVSIPRDTCANVPYESKKINGVYAYSGGIDGLKSAVADMTGYEVDSYVKVNIKGFAELIDTIGGVGFDIPYNMNYDDPTQNLSIHFTAGYRELTGSEAVKVVRWRQNNDGSNYGDIVRINTQQEFLKTVAKKCLSLNNIATKLKDYADIFKTYVDTDLTTGNLIWYGQQFFKLSMDNINFYTMPANYYDSIKGFSYGTILVDEWLEMLNENFNPYNEQIKESDINIITRNSAGELYATSGSISGGYGSFLDYNEFLSRLNAQSGSQEDEELPGEEDPEGAEEVLPVTEEPTAGEQTTGEPAPAEPTAGEQTTDEPTPVEPTAGEQTTDEPAPAEPTAGEQTTDEPAPVEPTAEETGTDVQTGEGE